MTTRMLWASALVVLLAGCSTEVVVESNTSWEGDICGYTFCASAYSDHELRGSGNRSFDQGLYIAGSDSNQVCYWFGNTTDSGYVRVYIKDNNIFGSSKNARHENSAPHGAVSACATQ